MSGGQWEVVGRKKDRSSNSKLPVRTNNEATNKTPGVSKNPVKIEDIFSKEQVKNMYTTTKGKQDVQKAQEKHSQKTSSAKVSQTPKKTDKAQEAKIPKSIDSALSNINAIELKGIFEKYQVSFPNQPVVWLKEMVNYFNMKMPLEISDPVFASKTDGFPWIVIPTAIKSIIESTIKQVGSPNAQLFFDISMNTMIDDMLKQHSAMGSKIYLQYIAMTDPKLILQYLSAYTKKLKGSYQNQTPIGQSICWVFAQAGFNDFKIGLEVFQKMFVDLLSLKNYSRCVTKYLVDLVNRHSKISISDVEYFILVELIYSPKKNFPTDLTKDLNNLIPILNIMFFENNKSSKNKFIEPLLKLVRDNKHFSEVTCQPLLATLSKDVESYKIWKKLYSSNISSSAVVLNHLVDNWKRNKAIIYSKNFGENLKTFTTINEQLMGNKKKYDGLSKSMLAIKTLNKKMVTKNTSCCSFKYIPLLLFCSASMWIYYDVSKHGSWNESCTSKALNRTGVYDYTNRALDCAHQGSLWVQDRIEEKFPGFSANAKELTGPYVELCGHLHKVGCNLLGNMKDYLTSCAPIVLETIDYYAPGAVDTTRQYAYTSWNTVVDANYKIFAYFRDQVFVGNLSPENMKKIVLEMTSLAYEKASEGVKWVYEKIETATK